MPTNNIYLPPSLLILSEPELAAKPLDPAIYSILTLRYQRSSVRDLTHVSIARLIRRLLALIDITDIVVVAPLVFQGACERGRGRFVSPIDELASRGARGSLPLRGAASR